MKNEIIINSVSEFIKATKDSFDLIKNENETHNMWFRGESEKYTNTNLVPSFYRTFTNDHTSNLLKISDKGIEFFKTIEDNLKFRFNTSASNYINSIQFEKNKWNLYYLMQHYGVTTRLLDWTENALTALFFAVEKEDEQNNSIVWVLNPYSLNFYSLKSFDKVEYENYDGYSIFCPDNIKYGELIKDNGFIDLEILISNYFEMKYEDNNIYYPIAILPHLFDPRMKYQKSGFTLFGNVINGLEKGKNSDKYLFKIIVNKENIKSIKDELIWLGVNNESAYPGLEGVAKDIMYEQLKRVT